MSDDATITLTNALSELERVGSLIETFGEAHGVPTRARFELQLALDEVLTNVISYAFADAGPHTIIVRFAASNGEVVIEVEDDGRPFNPLDVPTPDVAQSIEERPIGGLGIHLVRRVTDGLEYYREGDKNRLVMRKAIAPAN